MATTERLFDILAEFFYQGNYSETILRESVQNAGDSLCESIKVYVNENEKTLTVIDNGIGIHDESVIRDLGKSLKFTDFSKGNLGLAKAILFSNPENCLKSVGKCYRKSHLINDNLPAENSNVTVGTIYSAVEFDKPLNEVKRFLESLLFGDIKIYLNDELIACKYHKINSYCTQKYDVYKNPVSSGYVTIAVNGVSSFSYRFNQLVTSLLVNFHFEGDVLKNPDDFPLTANRDNLKQKFYDAVLAIPEVKSAIDEQTKIDAENLARESRLSSASVEFGKMVIGGKNIQLYSTGYMSELEKIERSKVIKKTTRAISTYKRYIEQINALCIRKYNESNGFIKIKFVDSMNYLRFGYAQKLSDGSYVAAAQLSDGIFEYFFLNPEEGESTKGRILALAIHEFTHITFSGHSEDYASALTTLTGWVNDAIFNGDFRK